MFNYAKSCCLLHVSRVGKFACVRATTIRWDDENYLWLEGIQLRRFIRDFRDVIVVVTQPEFYRKAASLTKMLQQLMERIQAVTTDYTNSELLSVDPWRSNPAGVSFLAQRRQKKQLIEILGFTGKRSEQIPKFWTSLQEKFF